MDEITLINLLNTICEKNGQLTWKLNCRYQEESDTSVMQVQLMHGYRGPSAGTITFLLETGKIIEGNHQGMVEFRKSTHLVDALLDILYYENNKLLTSLN